MKDVGNLHQRVQEMCDCYATTDPLKEMSKMAGETADPQESSIKWLSLAILHGITNNAEKISIEQDDAGKVVVQAEYRPAELPAPNKQIAETVFATVRGITHIEDKGKLPLSIGIRGSSADLEVKLKSKDGRQKLKLEFK